MKCIQCNRYRGTIDGLCDDCTIKIKGKLLPWFKPKEDKQ